jgi:hypothetical protein
VPWKECSQMDERLLNCQVVVGALTLSNSNQAWHQTLLNRHHPPHRVLIGTPVHATTALVNSDCRKLRGGRDGA